MNKKNWLMMLLTFVVAFATFSSCKKSDEEANEVDEWVKVSALDGDPRSAAAGFQIGNIGYISTGLIGANDRAQDTWAFNTQSGEWIKKADFPGAKRNEAVGFAIGNQGFVGTGFDGNSALNDFYKFDQTTNTWTKIADFPGEARYGAVAFSIGNFGYVGCGTTSNDKNLKDFYKYDPATNKWESITSNIVNKRKNPFVFVINNKAYIGGGVDNNLFVEDFYEFDGQKFTQLEDIKSKSTSSSTYNVTRKSATTMVINNLGYVVGGSNPSVLSSIWEYNPATKTWNDDNQVFQGSARESAVSFSANGAGFVVTGKNGTSRYDDNWKFTPVK
ncbi:hypothetical protein J5U18_07425 [Sphingobacteriaceae bacterium WQ 2009]|uniref:Galactose oxidase n=1 Tax=Rhinopithecimicrobium faecis TaxID=2820698 RepID=A0A8T4HFE1_9SPHI|nr:hypothetical protein [Sphingobacteriaceae bacterium WQ 2009]